MKTNFYRKKRFWIALFLLVFLFDWVPFYFAVQYLGWQDGGLKRHQVDATVEGYIQNQNLYGCHYEQCWTPLLYTSPNRLRLKFVEFEIKNFSEVGPKYLGIPPEGNGWYRVQFEKRPLEDCPLLLRKREGLNRYVVREGNPSYEREVKVLNTLGESQICPYVRKVGAPKSRHMERDMTDSVLYRDGVHMIYRTDFRYGVDRLSGFPLYHYVRFAGSGTWLQPCRRGPSDGCGDLSPGFVVPKMKEGTLPGKGIFDLLGFANFSMNIDDLIIENK